jgi:uncharacterized protein with ParB-like and HNH nuclease domain
MNKKEELIGADAYFDDFINNLPFQLAIDSYQRPYVWDEEKVNEELE